MATGSGTQAYPPTSFSGNTSVITIPSNATAGTYSYSLACANSSGTSSATPLNLAVISPPQPNFGGSTTVSQGSSLSLTNSAGCSGTLYWNWSGPGSSFASGQGNTIPFSASAVGVHNFTATCVSSPCNSQPALFNITVLGSGTAVAPSSPTLALSQTLVCQNSYLQVTVGCPTGNNSTILSTSAIGAFVYTAVCTSGSLVSAPASISYTVLSPPTSPTITGGTFFTTTQNSPLGITATCPVGATLSSPCCISYSIVGSTFFPPTNNTGTFVYQPLCVRNTGGAFCVSMSVPVTVVVGTGITPPPSTTLSVYSYPVQSPVLMGYVQGGAPAIISLGIYLMGGTNPWSFTALIDNPNYDFTYYDGTYLGNMTTASNIAPNSVFGSYLRLKGGLPIGSYPASLTVITSTGQTSVLPINGVVSGSTANLPLLTATPNALTVGSSTFQTSFQLDIANIATYGNIVISGPAGLSTSRDGTNWSTYTSLYYYGTSETIYVRGNGSTAIPTNLIITGGGSSVLTIPIVTTSGVGVTPGTPTLTLSSQTVCQGSLVSATLTCPMGGGMTSVGLYALNTSIAGTFSFSASCPFGTSMAAGGASAIYTVNAAPPAPTVTGGTYLTVTQNTSLTFLAACAVGMLAPSQPGGNVVSVPTANTGTIFYSLSCYSPTGCISSITSVTVVILPAQAPPPSPPIITGSTVVCQGSPGQFFTLNVACPTGSVSIYSIDPVMDPSGTIGSLYSTTLGANLSEFRLKSWETPGTYSYAISCSNSAGISSPIPLTLAIIGTPPQPNFGGSQTVAQGSTLSLSNVAGCSGTTLWNWVGPNNSFGSGQGNVIPVTTSVIGVVSGTATCWIGGCRSEAALFNVTIAPAQPSNTTLVVNPTALSLGYVVGDGPAIQGFGIRLLGATGIWGFTVTVGSPNYAIVTSSGGYSFGQTYSFDNMSGEGGFGIYLRLNNGLPVGSYPTSVTVQTSDGGVQVIQVNGTVSNSTAGLPLLTATPNPLTVASGTFNTNFSVELTNIPIGTNIEVSYPIGLSVSFDGVIWGAYGYGFIYYGGTKTVYVRGDGSLALPQTVRVTGGGAAILDVPILPSTSSAPNSPIITGSTVVCQGSPLFTTITCPVGATLSYYGDEPQAYGSPYSLSANLYAISLPANAAARTYSYTVFCGNSAGISPPTFLALTVQPQSQTIISMTATSGQALTLNPGCNSNYSWLMDQRPGGGYYVGLISTGGNLELQITVVVSTIYSTTCASTSAGCGPIVSYSVTVADPPSSPTILLSSATVCQGGLLTATMVCSGQMGSMMSWLPTFNTGTFMVGAVCGMGISTSPVTGSAVGGLQYTVLPTPPQPFFNSGLTALQNSTFTLSSTACPGTLHWNWVAPGNSFTMGSGNNIPIPTSTTGLVSGTAVCQAGSCISPAGLFSVMIVPAQSSPTSPTLQISSVSVCQGNPVSLNVTCPVGSVSIYSVDPVMDPSGTIGGLYSTSVANQSTFRLLASAPVGTYSYGISCSNSAGTSAPMPLSITVVPTPAASLMLTNGGRITCAVPSVTLTLGGGSTYLFIGPGVSQNGPVNTIVISQPGVYSAVVVNASGCASATSVTVTSDVAVPTIASFTGGTLTCANTSLTLLGSATGTGSLTYAASGPGGFFQANTSGVFGPVTVPGVYSLTVMAPNGCAATTVTTVGSDTVVPTLIVTNNSPVCEGQLYTITATSGFTSYSLLNPINPAHAMVIFGTDGNPSQVSYNGQQPNGAPASIGPVSYTVVAQAANGCRASASTTVTIHLRPTATLTASGTISCAQPSVTLTASGGASYTLNNGQSNTTGIFAVNSAGIYSVMVSSSAGCTASATTTVTNDESVPTITGFTGGTLTCANTSLTLLASATSAGSLTYAVSGPGGFQQANTSGVFGPVTAPGVYSLTVTSANGCTATTTSTVVSNTFLPMASLSVTNGGVLNCTNPMVTLTATGGGSYQFSGPMGLNTTTNPLAVSLPGVYSVMVTGANGCTVLASTTVSSNTTTPMGGLTFVSPLTCARTTTTLIAFGGSSYIFSGPGLSQSGASSTAIVSQAGTYSVLITGSNGCTAVTAVFVPSNTTAPAIASFGPDGTLTCSTPTLNLSVTATGQGSLSYAFGTPGAGFAPASTNSILTVSTPGTYTVLVTDVNGCTASATTTVVSNTAAPVASLTANSLTLTCASPTATLFASGGVSYQFAGPGVISGIGSTTATGGVISGTALPPVNANSAVINQPGTYTVTVTGANGCTATSTITIQGDFAAPVASLTVSGMLTCANTSVSLLASGGVSYQFNGPSFSSASTPTNVLSVTAPGAYSVQVTAANGCTALASTTVGQNTTAPIASLTASGVLTCANPTVTLLASGGVGYQFAGTGLVSTSANTAQVNQPGTFSVIVTGANGCTATASVSVTSNGTAPTASLTFVNPLTCAQPSTVLIAFGGASYSFTGPGLSQSGVSSTAVVSQAGVYSVMVTGANGCTALASTTVTSNTIAPTASLTPSSATLTCANPSVMLVASGGTAYSFAGPGSFSTGNNMALVTQAGSYTVRVTAANGCTATATATISSNTLAPTASLTASGVLTCANPTVTLTASGGVGYFLSGPGLSFSNTTGISSVTAPGTYLVLVTATNGCTALASTTVTQNIAPPSATLVATNGGILTCSIPNVILTAGGGVGYAFSGPGLAQTGAMNTAVVSQTGIYSVLVTGANGCTALTSTTVSTNTNDLVQISAAVSGTATCAQAATVTVTSNAVSYVFGAGVTQIGTSNVAFVRSAGVYSVTGLSAGGCFNSTSFTVVEDKAAPTPTLSASGTITCINLSATLTAIGGVSYVIRGDDGINRPSITGQWVVSLPGLYSMTATAPNGCTAVTTERVLENRTLPSATLFATNNINCNNSDAILIAGGGVQFAFSGPGVSQNGTGNTVLVRQAGTYSVQVTSSNGCVATAQTTITGDFSTPVITAQANGVLGCSVATVSLTASGGTSYRFIGPGLNQSGASNTAQVSQVGTYTVIGTGANGCSGSATVSVTEDRTLPTATLTANGIITCANTSATLTATGGVSYRLSNGQTNTTGVFSMTAPGLYTVVVTASNSCTASASASITQNTATPTASLTASGVLSCTNTSVLLTASDSRTLAATQPGVYTVLITGANGCTALASTTVGADTSTPTASLTVNGLLTCTSNSVVLVASGGTSYAFTGPNLSQSGQSATALAGRAGVYSVMVTGANGCTAMTATTVLGNLDGPAISLSGNTTFCNDAGSSTQLTVMGQGTVLWSNGATTNTVSITAAGTYSVVLTGPNGCTAVATRLVTAVSCVTVAPPSPTPSDCGSPTATLGGSVTITGVADVSCSTGTFRILTEGGNGNPISFAGIVGMSNANPYDCKRQFDGPAAQLSNPNSSIQPFALRGVQVDGSTSNTFMFDFKAACGASTPPSSTTTAPPTNPTPAGCGSPTATLGGSVTVTGVADVNCVAGTFRILTVGGNGEAINFAGIAGVDNTQPYNCVRTVDRSAGLSVFALRGVQINPGGELSNTFLFNYGQICPSAPTPTPPNPTTVLPNPTPATCGSPTATLGGSVTITNVTDVNCVDGTFRIQTIGGNGEAINFIGISGLSNSDPYNCLRRVDGPAILAAINNATSNIEPFALRGMQIGGGPTNTFSFNMKRVCTGSARVAKPEPTAELEVTVLGNPTLSDRVTVEVRGAGSAPVTLQVNTALGQRVSEQLATPTEGTVRQTIELGRSAGVYLLRVMTPDAVKTVKIVRQ